MRFGYSMPLSVVAMCGSLAAVSQAAVTTFTSYASWQAQAGPFTTIDFTGFPANTIITEQYADLGIHFTDGTDRIKFNSGFLNDGVGLNGAFDEITLGFDTPQTTIAVWFPGFVAFKLYNDGQLIYQSGTFFSPPPDGTGGFAGLVTTQPFDAAIVYDPSGGVFIDDLMFGPPVPAPGALVGLLGFGLIGRRRR